MKIDFRVIHLKKRFPLAISRGIRTGSNNLFVTISKDGIQGVGEMSPGKTEGAATPEEGQKMLEHFVDSIQDFSSIKALYKKGISAGVAPCAYAALDIALWDWQAKKANIPLYQFLKMPLPTVPTSVTIGINPPEVVKERVPLLLQGTGVKALKIKLGSKEGIDADKAMFSQVVESCEKFDVKLRVDANGGWNIEEAQHMMDWLKKRRVDYIEQPLAEGNEDALKHLYKNRRLPIFLDESCRFASDVAKWAHCVDGVNIKLMKCGGITGALQIIEAAKKNNLRTMIGCMGESSVSIAAAAALTGVLNHVDLDSHLNLAPDPCEGAPLINGVIMPTQKPGHGAKIKDSTKDVS